MNKKKIKYLTAKLIDEEGLDVKTAFYKIVATKKEMAPPSGKPPKQPKAGGNNNPNWWKKKSYKEQQAYLRGTSESSAVKRYIQKPRPTKKGRLSKTKGRVKSAIAERGLGRMVNRMDRITNSLPLDQFEQLTSNDFGRQVYDTGKGLLMKANSPQAMFINDMEGKYQNLSAKVIDRGKDFVVLEKLRDGGGIVNKILDKITDFAIKHASKKIKVNSLNDIFEKIDERFNSNLSSLTTIMGDKSLNEVAQLFHRDNWGIDKEGMLKLASIAEVVAGNTVPPKYKKMFEEVKKKQEAAKKLEKLIKKPPKGFGDSFITMDRSKITPEYLKGRLKGAGEYLDGFMDVIDPDRSKMEFVGGRIKEIVKNKKSLPELSGKSMGSTSWFDGLSYNEQIKYIKSLKSPKAKAKWKTNLKPKPLHPKLKKIGKTVFSVKLPQCPECSTIDVMLADISDIKPHNQVWTIKSKHKGHTRVIYLRGKKFQTEDIVIHKGGKRKKYEPTQKMDQSEMVEKSLTDSWFDAMTRKEQLKYIKKLKSPKLKAKWGAKLKPAKTKKKKMTNPWKKVKTKPKKAKGDWYNDINNPEKLKQLPPKKWQELAQIAHSRGFYSLPVKDQKIVNLIKDEIMPDELNHHHKQILQKLEPKAYSKISQRYEDGKMKLRKQHWNNEIDTLTNDKQIDLLGQDYDTEMLDLWIYVQVSEWKTVLDEYHTPAAIYTTPVPLDPESYMYHAYYSDTKTLNSIENKQFGNSGLFISPLQDTAENYGSVVIRAKVKDFGNIYLDPDVYSEDGFEDEMEDEQYINGTLPLDKVDIIIDGDHNYMDLLRNIQNKFNVSSQKIRAIVEIVPDPDGLGQVHIIPGDKLQEIIYGDD